MFGPAGVSLNHKVKVENQKIRKSENQKICYVFLYQKVGEMMPGWTTAQKAEQETLKSTGSRRGYVMEK